MMSDTFNITQSPDDVNTYFYPNDDYAVDYSFFSYTKGISTLSYVSVTDADDLSHDGTYLFVTRGSSGISAYSFDGTNFSLEATQDDGGTYFGTYSNSSYVYACIYNDGIRAYTFDGSSFTLKDTHKNSDYYSDVWADGSYIYVVCSGNGIEAYSFDGTNFSLEATQDDGGYYYGVWGDGTYIYTACFGDGIRAYSFDGSTFTLEDTQDDGGTYGYYQSLCGDGNYIYVTCYDEGIRAYSFNGSTFTLEDTQDDGGYYQNIYCKDGYIYTTTSNDDLYIYTFNGSNFSLKTTGENCSDIYSTSSYIFTVCDDNMYAKQHPYITVNIDDLISNCNYDTDYISTTNTSFVSAYFDIEDHTTETGTINYVKLYTTSKATGIDSTSGSSFYLSLSDGTDYSNSINHSPLSTGYKVYSTAFASAPDSSDWSWTDIDSTKIGLKMKADNGNELRCSQLYLMVNYTPSDSTVSLLLPDKVSRSHSRNVERYLFPDGEYSVIDSGRNSKTLTLSGIHVTGSVSKIENLENMLDYGNTITLSSLPDSNMNTTYMVQDFNIEDMGFTDSTTDRVYRWSITLEKT